jgi:hypothetical protein
MGNCVDFNSLISILMKKNCMLCMVSQYHWLLCAGGVGKGDFGMSHHLLVAKMGGGTESLALNDKNWSVRKWDLDGE